MERHRFDLGDQCGHDQHGVANHQFANILPVEDTEVSVALEKALTKLERLQGTPQSVSEAEHLRALARELTRKFPERIASRIGERVVFVDMKKVTHFYAKDRLTYAATASKDYVIDVTISELEEKLDPAVFIRIHRGTLLNINYVDEVSSWIGGGLIVRLKDGKRTELHHERGWNQADQPAEESAAA